MRFANPKNQGQSPVFEKSIKCQAKANDFHLRYWSGVADPFPSFICGHPQVKEGKGSATPDYYGTSVLVTAYELTIM